MEKFIINGKEYPANFGLYALRLIGKRFKAKKLIDMTNALQNIGLDDMPFVVLSVIENGCLDTDIKPPSIEEVEKELNKNVTLMFKAMAMLQLDADDLDETNKNVPVEENSGN